VHRPEGRADSGAGSPGDGRTGHRREEPVLRADAVVLAGGRATRLGGVDKPALVVGERSLVASVVSAATGAGARRVVVVGPARPGLELAGGGLRVVREDPPGSGPVPALHRGLAEATAPWVFVLAADLPFIRAAELRSLLTAAAEGSASGGAAGAVLADDTGRPQWLAGCWPAAALHAAIGVYPGGSLHGLLGPLRPAMVGPATGRAGPPPWLDCDTEEDVRLARAWCRAPARSGPNAPR
jgi:molybdopterin-guanine dinucleotide biosynthesis protein A